MTLAIIITFVVLALLTALLFGSSWGYDSDDERWWNAR